ncbi:hypothetical protein [Nocardiopsis sp. CNT312]|uniref:hypothetical protein n=1 Tax=Nocardiopsis sp. CNT312 TaxID=1137268 RepID=UPI00048E438C|nr:hypothetical protein [Nocardiopsis sp. CNT312]
MPGINTPRLPRTATLQQMAAREGLRVSPTDHRGVVLTRFGAAVRAHLREGAWWLADPAADGAGERVCAAGQEGVLMRAAARRIEQAQHRSRTRRAYE